MKTRVSLILLAFLCVTLTMQGYNPYDGYDEVAYMDMNLEQNLLNPSVPEQGHKYIKNFMVAKAKELAAKKYNVELTRNDEVIVVTIPTDELFMPNDTLLLPTAPTKILPVLKMVEDPDMFKLVYAVHTDNTGSPGYNLSLAHKRNNSIYDWMLDVVNENLIVIPFEMGDKQPLNPNTNRKLRAKNRRLEIFLIPGPKLIQKSLNN